MGCGDEKLSKYLTQTFTAHCNAMICQQVTLLGDAEWPKVADAVIEAECYAKFHPERLHVTANPSSVSTVPFQKPPTGSGRCAGLQCGHGLPALRHLP